MANRKRSKKKAGGAGMPYAIAVTVCAVVVAAQFFAAWAKVSVMGSTVVELGPFSANDALSQVRSVPFVSAMVPENISTQIQVWYIASIVSIVLVAASAVLSLVAQAPARALCLVAAAVPIAVTVWFLVTISGYSEFGFVNTYAPVVIIVASVVLGVASLAAPQKAR